MTLRVETEKESRTNRDLTDTRKTPGSNPNHLNFYVTQTQMTRFKYVKFQEGTYQSNGDRWSTASIKDPGRMASQTIDWI